MNVTDDEFAELLTLYIEGEATESQLQQLLSAIKASPDRRSWFQNEARINSLLRETIGEYVELQVIQNSTPIQVKKKSSSTQSPFWWIALAGALLVAVGSIWFSRMRTEEQAFPTMGSFMSLTGGGQASILRNDKQMPAAQDFNLREGDRVICGISSQAMLRLADGSILAMEPGSELTLVSSRPEIKLEKGEVLFEVAKRKESERPFQVRTSESTVDVLGTIFTLTANDFTELAVFEGEVTLTRHSDNSQITVASQQRTSTNETRLAVQELEAPRVPTPVKIVTLFPTDDITLDRNQIRNTEHLKIEGDRRVAFLRFDVPPNRTIRSAVLRLTQSVDTGSGELLVSVGEHGAWREADAKPTQLPDERLLAASRSGPVGRGQVIELDIKVPLEPGALTLMLTLDQKGENDIWFASRESDTPPQLSLTLEAD